MVDITETKRRLWATIINNNPADREKLEKAYGPGNVWSSDELQNRFNILGFMAPFCVVEDRQTGKIGSVLFQHEPRLYFGFQEE